MCNKGYVCRWTATNISGVLESKERLCIGLLGIKQMDQQTDKCSASALSFYWRKCVTCELKSQVYNSTPRSVITPTTYHYCLYWFPSEISANQCPDIICLVCVTWSTGLPCPSCLSWCHNHFSPKRPFLVLSHDIYLHLQYLPTRSNLHFLPLLSNWKGQVNEIDWMETQGNKEVCEPCLEMRWSTGPTRIFFLLRTISVGLVVGPGK